MKSSTAVREGLLYNATSDQLRTKRATKDAVYEQQTPKSPNEPHHSVPKTSL
jgi:hypothetical protein